MLEEFEHFARRVLGVMSASVGLAPEHIANVFGDDPQPYAKLITYPPTPPIATALASLRLGVHYVSHKMSRGLQAQI